MQKNKIMKKIFSLFSRRIALFWLAFLSIASVMMFTNCELVNEIEPKEEDKKKDKKKDKQDDPVVVAKTNLEYVTTIGTGSAVTHPANTGFNLPYGADVANGKLYVLDVYNYRVQVYTNLSGTPAYEKTIGAGSAVTDNTGFNEPFGMTVANGKLYVADALNYRVQIYTNLSGTPTHLDTIGTGTRATDNTGFNEPYGVAVANGKLYVADTGSHRVQIYTNLSGTPTYLDTIGSVSAVRHPTNTGFNGLVGVTVADSKLYVADNGNHRVQIYTNLSGTPTYEKTIGTGSAVTDNTGFNSPYKVAVANGKLYVADSGNHRVQVYGSLSGTPTVENTIGTGAAVNHPANTGFNRPYGVAVAGDKVYVLDTFNQRIQVYQWK